VPGTFRGEQEYVEKVYHTRLRQVGRIVAGRKTARFVVFEPTCVNGASGLRNY
jgi:hypothetical protein